jgi:uncharacterized damage-inducible protein DinB
MGVYGGRQLADAFRTVRKNTITIAEEFTADQYGFRPVPEVRTVAELLAHIAVIPGWQMMVHGERIGHIDFELFSTNLAKRTAEEQALKTKDEILRALTEGGDRFAAFLESMSDETLAEEVTLPPPVGPSSKSRLEMLMAAKEHEMHHRGQLMVYQRMLGLVPHLTRQREQMRATGAAQQKASAAGR